MDIAGEHDDSAAGMVRPSRIHWCTTPRIQRDHRFTPIKFVGGLEEVPLHDHDRPEDREDCPKCQNPNSVPPCQRCLATERPTVPIIINVIFGGFVGSPVYRRLGGSSLSRPQRIDLLSFLLPYSGLDEVEGALELLRTPLQLRAMMGLARGRADSESLRDDSDDLYVTEAAGLLRRHIIKRKGHLMPVHISGVCSNVERTTSCKDGTKISENRVQKDGKNPVADKVNVSFVTPTTAYSEHHCSGAKLRPEPPAPNRRFSILLCCSK